MSAGDWVNQTQRSFQTEGMVCFEVRTTMERSGDCMSLSAASVRSWKA